MLKYKSKYLKYKFKYLNLKGGATLELMEPESMENDSTNLESFYIDSLYDGGDKKISKNEIDKSISENNTDKLIKIIINNYNIGMPIGNYTSPMTLTSRASTMHNTDEIKTLEDIKYFLEKFTNKEEIINTNSSTGLTPLNEAIKKKYMEIIKYFVSIRVDINQPDGQYKIPLIQAMDLDLYDICLYLLKQPTIDINKTYHKGKTILHHIAEKHFNGSRRLQNVIQQILLKDGDMNKQDDNGYTPLYYAVLAGNLKFICMLEGKKPKNISFDLNEKNIVEIAEELVQKETGKKKTQQKSPLQKTSLLSKTPPFSKRSQQQQQQPQPQPQEQSQLHNSARKKIYDYLLLNYSSKTV